MPKRPSVLKAVFAIGCLFIGSFAEIAKSQTANELSAKEIAKKTLPAVMLIICHKNSADDFSYGSGFFVKPGILVTNYHVIQGKTCAVVQTGSRADQKDNVFEITDVLIYDSDEDLALLNVPEAKSANIPLLLIEREVPAIGETIYALGNPKGLTGTISPGIISARLRTDRKNTRLQISAPISPGSSGGPVVNGQGRVIGVAVEFLRDGQNLNFAVPAQFVNSLLTGLFPPRTSAAQTPPATSDLKPKRSVREVSSPRANLPPKGPDQPTVRTLFPVLANITFPASSGVLVESLDGKVVIESKSGEAFNAGSIVKIATAFGVLKFLGPEFRFRTNIQTDGAIDQASRTLNGNLYISGRDPIFSYQHALSIANELNRMGIDSISGDLVVSDSFTMNSTPSPEHSGKILMDTMNASKRRLVQPSSVNKTDVKVSGSLYVRPMPDTEDRLIEHDFDRLFEHDSAPLSTILKMMLCYSDNFLAGRLGDFIGGPDRLSRIVQLSAEVKPEDFNFGTASGPGYNRISPTTMMKIWRALRGELAKNKLRVVDIMPVAGIDDGTLKSRFNTGLSLGSVVGETAFADNRRFNSFSGQVNTRNGPFIFVIFNESSTAAGFRAFQDHFITILQGQLGGPIAFEYEPVPIKSRASQTLIHR